MLPKKNSLKIYSKLVTVITFGNRSVAGRESTCEEECMHCWVIFSQNIMMCIYVWVSKVKIKSDLTSSEECQISLGWDSIWIEA